MAIKKQKKTCALCVRIRLFICSALFLFLMNAIYGEKFNLEVIINASFVGSFFVIAIPILLIIKIIMHYIKTHKTS